MLTYTGKDFIFEVEGKDYKLQVVDPFILNDEDYGWSVEWERVDKINADGTTEIAWDYDNDELYNAVRDIFANERA